MAPVVLYTNITSGPNRGGEHDKGIYLSIFGKNFGASGLGATTKVFVGDSEVDNYRYLGASRGRADIQQITVQIGALGDPKPGLALPVKVVVGGRPSNINVTFTVNPGTIYFVSLSGSDVRGVPGDVSHPYRTVQTAHINNNGVPGCPRSSGNQAIPVAGVWGAVQGGDFIVMRGGAWTDVSKDGFFLRAQNKSGSAPTGISGSGPITVMGYPGESVLIDRTNRLDDQPGGGISSADTARQKLGCGAWVTLTNLAIESGFNDGVVSTQRGADNPVGSHWRVVNNEMTAVSCQNNSKCRGAGVSGSGVGGYWVGNHVHNVYDRPDGATNFENHGFYVDGMGSYEIAYNLVERIFGGNGIQTYSTSSAQTNNVSIHHNLIRDVGKHGINIADGTAEGVFIYNNVVSGTDVAGLRFNTTRLRGAKIYNNTFFNTDRLNAGSPIGALMNDWHLPPESIDFRNNIVVPGGAGRNYVGGSVKFGAVSAAFSHNAWFDGAGVPPGQSTVRDPLFVSSRKEKEDFRLQQASPAIDAGSAEVSAVARDDFDADFPRPSGRGYDIGAFEYRTDR